MLDISRGCRGAHADGLVMAIDPVEIAVEPAGTFAEPMKLIDNVGNEIRSEEHTSELQSLMRISYAVFCLKKKKTINQHCRSQQKRNAQITYSHTYHQ